jgi:lipid-A-disaccharide synthase
MKYYLIAGEASGDLHAARLMRSLKKEDPNAAFRFIGGDMMTAEGGERLQHFKEIAYMGFLPVLLHLRTILSVREKCKRDIEKWKPDAVILVDYAGFNLSIAKFLRKQALRKQKTFFNLRHRPSSKESRLAVSHSYKHTSYHQTPLTFYYISPKIWAWKEWRIKNFKRDVDDMFCILPFEVDFFERKHGYKVHYVGNPTANEVGDFKKSYSETYEQFCLRHGLDGRPVIALLAGSRRHEIKDNLPLMTKVAKQLSDYQFVLACAPSVDEDYYVKFLRGSDIKKVTNETYALLTHAKAALVTSGTATLETCCFNVPQVVLYKTPLPRISRFVWNHFFSVKYISLVNLIAGKEVVAEMMAEKFTVEKVLSELRKILPGSKERNVMLSEYFDVHKEIGGTIASDNAAHIMIRSLLNHR